MDQYAGLDVSLEETAICVVDGTGWIVKEARVGSEPDALIAALGEIDLPLERVGLEACSLTAWLHDELRSAGLPAIWIKTRQANAAMRTMPNKTDRNDARALAQIMRTGWFRQAHVKSRQCRLWRSLLVAPHGPERDAGRRPQARHAGPRGVCRARARARRRRSGRDADRGAAARGPGHDAGPVRPHDEAGVRRRPTGRGLPAADERARDRARSPRSPSGPRSTGRTASGDRATSARISA